MDQTECEIKNCHQSIGKTRRKVKKCQNDNSSEYEGNKRLLSETAMD